MSLKPKKKKQRRPNSGESESVNISQRMKTHNLIRITIPPEKVNREKITESIKRANTGAKQFQSFQLEPTSVEILPYKPEADKRILKAKVKKAWQAGTWRSGRMTSIPLPISEMSSQHARTEQMPYYADLARDEGLIFDAELFKAYRENDAFYVEFVFEGFQTTEWAEKTKLGDTPSYSYHGHKAGICHRTEVGAKIQAVKDEGVLIVQDSAGYYCRLNKNRVYDDEKIVAVRKGGKWEAVHR